MTRRLICLATLAFVIGGPAAVQTRGSAQPRAMTSPTFQVDSFWPKPLPNHWILGSVTGVASDAQDHIWVVHRGMDSLTTRTEVGLGTKPPTAEGCCAPAPPVLEFDQAGNLVRHWGGPGQGYEWPQSPGGIKVDSKGNVWITAAGPPVPPTSGAAQGGGQGQAARGAGAAPARPEDAHVLQFTRTGQFVRQIGQPGKSGGNQSTTGLNRPANVDTDESANELYVADGVGNHRIIVFDATTGAYKRHWGAYGAKPDDASQILGPYDPDAPPAKQFRTVSCVRVAKDGVVYVCDRRNDRIQVFKKDGTFVNETFVSKTTRGGGSVWDIALSSDPQQQFLYVADGQNEQILVLRRETLQVIGQFGAGGRQPGQFYAVGSIAVDSKGNLYTGEMFEGKRVQKFIRK